MDLQLLAMVSTGQGLPPPSISGVTLDDEASFIRIIRFPPPGPLSPRVLDISTPLLTPSIDVRGNAQHWLIRCADAALERTQPQWLRRFETEDAYQTLVAERTNPAFAGFYDARKVSRHGVPMDIAQAKHDRRALGGYAKAVENWNRAFGNSGDDFYDVLLAAGDRYAEATARYLGLVGLNIRHFKGAFSLHIMLMCGNVDAVRFIGNNSTLLALDFPGAPIIPSAFRMEFVQNAMAVLNRDLYLDLPQPNIERVNTLLDGVLGAAVGTLYDPPPFSFMHVEDRGGGLYLHSVALFGTAPRPPAARSFWVPLRQPVAAPGQVLLLADLFAQGERGINSIASCTMVIEDQQTNLDQIQLWLVRTDAGDPEQQLNLHIPNQVTVTTPLIGERWQIMLRFPGVPPTILSGFAQGHFWFSDTAGLESEHVPWRIAGSIPRALGFGAFSAISSDLPNDLFVVTDLFSRGFPGNFPLARGHIRCNSDQFNTGGVGLWISRSDFVTPDFQLNATLGLIFDFVAVPLGVTWDLYLLGPTPTAGVVPVFLSGEMWFSDTQGFESNRVGWTVVIGR